MLRNAAIASLGLRRLIAASAPAVSSETSILLRRFICSQTPGVRTGRIFAPVMHLSRGYEHGRVTESNDEEEGEDSESDVMDEAFSDFDSEEESENHTLDFYSEDFDGTNDTD